MKEIDGEVNTIDVLGAYSRSGYWDHKKRLTNPPLRTNE
jgi:hypothetical protein